MRDLKEDMMRKNIRTVLKEQTRNEAFYNVFDTFFGPATQIDSFTNVSLMIYAEMGS